MYKRHAGFMRKWRYGVIEWPVQTHGQQVSVSVYLSYCPLSVICLTLGQFLV